MPRPAGPGHTEVLCSRAQSLALSRGRGLRRLFVADGPFRMVLNIRHRTSKSGHLHEARTMPRGWPWGQGTAEPARCAGRGRAPRALVDALSRARLLRRRRGDGRSRWDDGPPRRTRQAQSSRGAGPAWLQLNVGPRTQDLPLLDRFDASRSPGVFDDRLQNTRVFPEAPSGAGKVAGHREGLGRRALESASTFGHHARILFDGAPWRCVGPIHPVGRVAQRRAATSRRSPRSAGPPGESPSGPVG